MPVTLQEAVSGIQAMCESRGWKYQLDSKNFRFRMQFNLPTSRLSACDINILLITPARAPDLCNFIISYGVISSNVTDLKHIDAVCEYITRANYGLKIGNFELDRTDGEIRFKIYCFVGEELPSAAILDTLVRLPVIELDRYGNGLLAVSMGLLSPSEAIEQAEAS